MQVTITTKNMDLGESLRDYVENKTNRLDRYLPEIDEAHVELTNQNTRNAEESQVAQVTLFSKGTVLRAEERSGDMRSSVDAALDKMTRQIRRYKGKHWRSHSRHQPSMELAEALEEMDEQEAELDELDQIIRTKRFGTRPMDVEEAIEQMELLGHDFFIFYNMAEGGFSVVYRRRDGGYGLLIPELA